MLRLNQIHGTLEKALWQKGKRMSTKAWVLMLEMGSYNPAWNYAAQSAELGGGVVG